MSICVPVTFLSQSSCRSARWWSLQSYRYDGQCLPLVTAMDALVRSVRTWNANSGDSRDCCHDPKKNGIAFWCSTTCFWITGILGYARTVASDPNVSQCISHHSTDRRWVSTENRWSTGDELSTLFRTPGANWRNLKWFRFRQSASGLLEWTCFCRFWALLAGEIGRALLCGVRIGRVKRCGVQIPCGASPEDSEVQPQLWCKCDHHGHAPVLPHICFCSALNFLTRDSCDMCDSAEWAQRLVMGQVHSAQSSKEDGKNSKRFGKKMGLRIFSWACGGKVHDIPRSKKWHCFLMQHDLLLDHWHSRLCKDLIDPNVSQCISHHSTDRRWVSTENRWSTGDELSTLFRTPGANWRNLKWFRFRQSASGLLEWTCFCRFWALRAGEMGRALLFARIWYHGRGADSNF